MLKIHQVDAFTKFECGTAVPLLLKYVYLSKVNETMVVKLDYGGAPRSRQCVQNIDTYIYTHTQTQARTHTHTVWQTINSKLKACWEDEEGAERLSSLVSSLDCWSSECAKSASKSSSIPQSLTQAANT